MATGSARAFAAAFRAIGLDAEPTPPSDHRTRELGARYTSGDECYPAKVTVGDFMKLLEDTAVDPARIALFMPTAEGPCRFGQYAPYLRHVLDSNGYQAVQILSPSSKNSYDGLGDLAKPFVRSGWRALLCADLLEKLLLMRRPYEQVRGDAEAAYEECLADLCRTIETTTVEPGEQLAALEQSMIRARERFRKLKLENRIWSLEALGSWVRQRVQKHDENRLVEIFREDFASREEPDIYEVLECARPYLPREGAFGEMVLNVGKAVYLAKKGAAGIIDISPFTCMNGIVCEAIYPQLSRDLGGIPIRNFYFDGTQSDLDRDLGVYMELARSYRKRRQLSV